MKTPLFIFLKILCTLAVLSWQVAVATPSTPTSDFIDNKDGTVTHKTTGLIWQRCSVGQTWTGSDCSGDAKAFTYAQALALTSDVAGQNDWRLPNIAELHTIVERENYSPAINKKIFPNTANTWFWSSSPDARYRHYAWVVSFSSGYDSYGDEGDGYLVRLVRGGQWTLGSLPYTTPNSDFVKHGDGTVTHKRTGLMWQRCSLGQTWTGSSCSGSASDYTYDYAVKLTSSFAGYNDWRLPTINELLSIVEYGTYYPAINKAVFPNTPSTWFWSSSPYASYSDYAWIVDFYNGDDGYGGEDGSNLVRLVRGGQWLLGSLPDGDINKAFVPLLEFATPISNYRGVTAYMNYANGSGDYSSTELALRFAQAVLHLTTPVETDGIAFAKANKDKTGYVESYDKRVNIVARYYPKGSTTPPINGAIISQTSDVTAGHVAIAKKVVKINDNALDVYFLEQNWLWTDKAGKSYIADSRKMRFTRNAKGKWTGGTGKNNVATGWLNPEVK